MCERLQRTVVRTKWVKRVEGRKYAPCRGYSLASTRQAQKRKATQRHHPSRFPGSHSGTSHTQASPLPVPSQIPPCKCSMQTAPLASAGSSSSPARTRRDPRCRTSSRLSSDQSSRGQTKCLSQRSPGSAPRQSELFGSRGYSHQWWCCPY